MFSANFICFCLIYCKSLFLEKNIPLLNILSLDEIKHLSGIHNGTKLTIYKIIHPKLQTSTAQLFNQTSYWIFPFIKFNNYGGKYSGVINH
jgi:hypothetical protein